MFKGLYDNPVHLLLVVLVVVLVFGANRLPGVAKSLGQSLKIFKSEVKDLRADAPSDAVPTTTVTPVNPVPPVAPTASQGTDGGRAPLA